MSAGLSWHPGPIAGTTPAWNFSWDPTAVATLCAMSCCYGLGLARLWSSAGVGHGLRVRDASCFFLGIAALAIALISPLDTLSDLIFSAHMSQHELLMVVAAPLVVLGRPLTAYWWALPARAKAPVAALLHTLPLRLGWRILTGPLLVLVMHTAVRWLWHLPVLFEAAMRHEPLHALQHLSFFLSASIFWWAIAHGRYGKSGYGLAVLFVFATALHTSILGALISLAPQVLYRIYETRTPTVGWQPLADQELAGFLMWIPTGVLLTLIGLGLFAAWLGEAERRARRNTPLDGSRFARGD
jgi:putative membrane protein